MKRILLTLITCLICSTPIALAQSATGVQTPLAEIGLQVSGGGLEQYGVIQVPVLLSEGTLTYWLLPEAGLTTKLNFRPTEGYGRIGLLIEGESASGGLELTLDTDDGVTLRVFTRFGVQ
jgi:hypothetical protein